MGFFDKMRLSGGVKRRLVVAVVLVVAFIAAATLSVSSAQSGLSGSFAPAVSVAPVGSDSSSWYCSVPSKARASGITFALQLTNFSSFKRKIVVSFGASGHAKGSTVVLNPRAVRSVAVRSCQVRLRGAADNGGTQ